MNPSSLQFSHWMRQEIDAQPDVIRTCCQTWATTAGHSPTPADLGVNLNLNPIEQIQILGCGTSLHAGWIGKLLLETWAKVPTTLLPASELRHTLPPVRPHTLTLAITQSGETADVIQGVQKLQAQDCSVDLSSATYLGLTNQANSTLATLTHQTIVTPAGKEVSIAATKTFTAKVMALYHLALAFSHQRQTLSPDAIAAIQTELQQVPTLIETILTKTEPALESIVQAWKSLQHCIILGRGLQAPIAAEAALKLKEAAYVHAEGFPTGEFLHGPVALLDETILVIAIAIPGSTYDYVLNALPKLKARHAPILVITTESGVSGVKAWADECVILPDVNDAIAPLLTIVPLQLLAYHWAVARQLNPDQPRGLVKSISQD